MIDKSFSSLPPIGGGINGAIPKGVIAPPLSGAPGLSGVRWTLPQSRSFSLKYCKEHLALRYRHETGLTFLAGSFSRLPARLGRGRCAASQTLPAHVHSADHLSRDWRVPLYRDHYKENLLLRHQRGKHPHGFSKLYVFGLLLKKNADSL
jgi:hypothetical protein